MADLDCRRVTGHRLTSGLSRLNKDHLPGAGLRDLVLVQPRQATSDWSIDH